MKRSALLLLAAFTGLLPAAAPVRAAPGGGVCVTRDRSAHVAIVVCPPSTPREALTAAAKTACDGLSPCNAWIWEDAATAPVRAPDVDTDMPKATTGKARAIWNDATGSLMELRRVR